VGLFSERPIFGKNFVLKMVELIFERDLPEKMHFKTLLT